MADELVVVLERRLKIIVQHLSERRNHNSHYRAMWAGESCGHGPGAAASSHAACLTAWGSNWKNA